MFKIASAVSVISFIIYRYYTINNKNEENNNNNSNNSINNNYQNKNKLISDEIKLKIINYILDDIDSLKNLRFTNMKWFNLVNQKFFGILTIKKYSLDKNVITYNKMNETDKKKYICNRKNCFFKNKEKEKERNFEIRYGAIISIPFCDVLMKINIIEFFLKNSDRILEHFCFTNRHLSISYQKDGIKNQFSFSNDDCLETNFYFIKSYQEINLVEVIDNLIKLRNQYNLTIYE
jgi:hypothetical protein